MMFTLSPATRVVAALLLATPLLAQRGLQRAPIPGPVRNAGTYHLASGTWTRAGQGHGILGDHALFRNDLPSGYFGYLDENEVAYDEGRLPGDGDHLVPGGAWCGTSDAYRVTGFQFGYCATTANPTSLEIAWYPAYSPCTDPTTLQPVAAFLLTGLPSNGCWLAAFDLSGSGFEFELAAEGADGVHDGDTALDDFGWSLRLDHDQGDGLGQTIAGPILSGDNGNLASLGEGTIWKNPTSPGTGLGTEDLFWLESPTVADGCYWFFGCLPCANFHNVLFGTEVVPDGGGDLALDCDDGADDQFEDNDTCPTATQGLLDGIYEDLYAHVDDEDWYCLEVGPHKTLRMDFPHMGERGDIDVELYASCGGELLAADLWDTNIPCIIWTNSTDRPVMVYARVMVDPTGPGDCNNYTMKVKRSCPTCDGCGGPDPWEENDGCGQATDLLTVPPTTELTIQPDDDDWFRFTVEAGCWFNVGVFFPHECADVNLELFDGCGNAPIDASTSFESYESVSGINASSGSREYRVRVYVAAGACASYDILLTEQCPGGSVDSYCAPAPANSVCLSGGVLESVEGYLTDAATFRVSDVPDQPGILYTGPNQIQLPFGCGERCVGGSVLRYPPVFPSGNQATITIDMSQAPGNVNTQYWYRDPAGIACGAAFNLSNALNGQ